VRAVSAWALVPVKGRAGKQRLATTLPAAPRERLMEQMLAHVLATLAACEELAGIAVLAPQQLALPPDVLWLPDAAADMNGALAAGLSELAARGARSVCIVAADLPRLAAVEVRALLAAAAARGAALAADHHGSGTNGLALCAPAHIPPLFGRDSLARHLAAARAQGLEPAVLRLPGLMLDVDEPADLARLVREVPEYAPLTR
jgi:2-phospho-L-lactate/phosphoenolpyruvate guanylyltransferase